MGYAPDLTQVEQALANNQGASDSGVYVYERLNEVVGFIAVVRFFYLPTLQDLTRITALCVDEQHRGLGIGGQLLSFAETLAFHWGDAAIEVTCSMQRQHTHRF